MLNISRPIIVEGKYDREKILSIASARVITTNGFGIFKDGELIKYIRKLAEKEGIIVLTDSDGAGLVIRNKINSILPKEKVFNIYVPEIKGKEKRKKEPSKQGLLGVEGIDSAWLENALSCFDGKEPGKNAYISKTDMYLLGLSGKSESGKLRKELAKKLNLPTNLSSTSLLSAINLLISKEEFTKALNSLGIKDYE
jgi:ribonuclease M5